MRPSAAARASSVVKEAWTHALTRGHLLPRAHASADFAWSPADGAHWVRSDATLA
jgi:hypothetical protein